MRRLLLCAWIALVAPAGCSGSDDGGPKPTEFDGIWQATSLTENDDGCAAEGASETPDDPYFELLTESLFGQTVVGYHACTSATDCDDAIDLGRTFSEKDDDGNWVGLISFASYSSYCHMGETVSTLLPDPDAETAIRIQTIMWTTSDAGLTESQCMDGDLEDLIDDHRADLACESLDVLRGTRVE